MGRLRQLGCILVVAATLLGGCFAAVAAPPVFPALGSAQSIRGKLVSADFIHRTGQFRTVDGELNNFTIPPYGIVTYLGTESDLRDVPLGTDLEFLLLPDDEGRPTLLAGTKHGPASSTPVVDEAQRHKFIEFTKARGIAGWVDKTEGKNVTVTFFSANPELFAATWDQAFAPGADVTACVANDELRTWQPTSCGERGKIVDSATVPIAGYGSSGRQVVIQVNNMLEGFRQGRIVRVFGAGWKVRNQLYQECLINYGYVSRRPPEFGEILAKHYPESFPYRTDYGNRHLPWYQMQEGTTPPLYSEHRMLGDLISLDAANQSGEFKTEGTGDVVKFTLLSASPRSSPVRVRSDSFEGSRSRFSDLQLGQRYRFTMYQDAQGAFTRCTAVSDEYSHLAFNHFNYQIRGLDLARGRADVDWQSVPVLNYQKDTETPPPYGHSFLRFVPETRVWKDGTAISPNTLKVGDYLKVNLTSEFPGNQSHCTEVWIVENLSGKARPKK